MRYLVLILGLCLVQATWAASDVYKTNTLSQYGITWTFDRPHSVGRFVTGDYYVIGPVTVVSITPEPTGARNGSRLNPRPGERSGFDSRVPGYEQANQDVLPIRMAPGDALLSTTSLADDEVASGVRTVDGSLTHHAFLRSAAILTCLDRAPPSDAFRPPYVAGPKPLYRVSQLRRDKLLNLAYTGSRPDIKQYVRIFQRPWIVHIPDWLGRANHPVDNMPNYYREVADAYSEASLMLLIESQNKDELLLPFLQEGIDHYFAAKAGTATSATNKWPILFTGILLNDPEMYSGFVREDFLHKFREDWQTYYAGEGASKLVSSVVPRDRGWTNWKKSKALWRQDPGDTEHEQRDPVTEWTELKDGGGHKREAYRHCCTSPTWVGMALAAHLMGAEYLWNHPAFFDYVDRWMEEDFSRFEPVVSSVPNAYPVRVVKGSRSRFIDDLWRKYRYVDSVAAQTAFFSN